MAGRMDLTVVDTNNVEDKITVGQQGGGGSKCGAGCDDIIIDYHPPLGYGSEQMKVRIQSVAVDTLDGIGIEWNAEGGRYSFTYRCGKVESDCIASPGSSDDTPVFRIVDKTLNEVGGRVSKQRRNVGRLLYLAERRAALGALELREIDQRAELVDCRACCQITKWDIPTFQPWPRGRNIPFVHACYLTAPCHCR